LAAAANQGSSGKGEYGLGNDLIIVTRFELPSHVNVKDPILGVRVPLGSVWVRRPRKEDDARILI